MILKQFPTSYFQYLCNLVETEIDLAAIFDTYGECLSNFDETMAELQLWKETWKSAVTVPETVIEAYEKCNESFFPNVKILLKVKRDVVLKNFI